MKIFCIVRLAAVFAFLNVSTVVLATDINGLWTKTTSPDPNNITIFYHEKDDLRAIGFSEIKGRKIVWLAEGEIEGKRLQCFYHYSQDALPPGWESEGIMKFDLGETEKFDPAGV
jgi:hypothetical protein